MPLVFIVVEQQDRSAPHPVLAETIYLRTAPAVALRPPWSPCRGLSGRVGRGVVRGDEPDAVDSDDPPTSPARALPSRPLARTALQLCSRDRSITMQGSEQRFRRRELAVGHYEITDLKARCPCRRRSGAASSALPPEECPVILGLSMSRRRPLPRPCRSGAVTENQPVDCGSVRPIDGFNTAYN